MASMAWSDGRPPLLLAEGLILRARLVGVGAAAEE
jgi:hypothetical protein